MWRGSKPDRDIHTNTFTIEISHIDPLFNGNVADIPRILELFREVAEAMAI